MLCKTSRSMPNFLWRQVISLFLVFCPWGPIGSAPSYTPIFFFPRKGITGGRVGIGDLAPNLDEFGWTFPPKWSQGWLPSHWGHQLSVGLFGRWFRWYRKRGWLKSNGNSTSWEVLKFVTFWEDWFVDRGIWKLLRICWGKCPIGMDKTSAFFMVWKPGMGWLIFPPLATLWVWGVFASLNTYRTWVGCHQGFLISSLRFGTSEKGEACCLRNRKLGRPLPLRSDAICCGPFRCSASALLFFWVSGWKIAMRQQKTILKFWWLISVFF